MNSKNKVIRIITWVLTILNICATVYYIIDSRKNHGKFRNVRNRLNSIKDELNDITEELNDLTNELNAEYKKETRGKDIDTKIEDSIPNVADIDDTEPIVENLDDEEVEE
jgi:hypothetical protein